MPALPSWHSRLPRIREALDQMTVPVLDRATIERLFGLSRRQAIRLMGEMGGHQAGRTYLVDRSSLSVRLKAIAEHGRVSAEIARKQRLVDSLDEARLLAIREAQPRTTPIAPVARAAACGPGWPAGVTCAPGELRISFTTAEDLLGRILALTERAAQDYDAFARSLAEAGGG